MTLTMVLELTIETKPYDTVVERYNLTPNTNKVQNVISEL